MSDWLHDLPVVWMTVVIFAATYAVAAAVGTFVAIAMVHSDNRTAAALALGLFATGAAVSVALIASHDRPFTGEISVGPGVLLQVMPEEPVPAAVR